jgi:hypothetical protein
MKIKIWLATAIILAGGLVSGTTAAAASPYCGITWGSGNKAAGSLSQASLLTVRTGRHDCYDRVVFEFTGTAKGYRVAYKEAFTQATGQPLSPYTAGGAVIEVVLLEPSTLYGTGQHVANVFGYNTLRDVVAGGSFEGYTTFAVGVRARLPYRVFTLNGPDTHSRIVIDVAHYW